MSENEQQIKDLLEQYVNKTISADDFSLLFDYMSKEENKHIVDAYMKQSGKIDFPDAEVHHIDWPSMYQNIISGPKQKSAGFWILNFPQKLVIAASLAMMIYLGYQWQASKQHQAATTAIVKQDVLPGGNKAILKLADGSEISLNDRKNGSLTVQGSTNINKSDEGLIEYQTANVGAEQKTYSNTLSTPRGGQYRLMLPDRTLVWLNAESSITFPTAFVGNERRVKITGEVYFEVHKDAKKPFFVESGQASLEVLGTHFNVMAYPNEEHSAVTLLEGAVKLSNNGVSRILAPGQQATFSANAAQILVRTVDMDHVVDWKNGLFIFEDASITEVMQQIERWYDVDVVYIGKMPTIKFTGIVSRTNNVSKLIKLLQEAGNINFSIQNKTIQVKQLTK